jgi:thiamine kinase-like enzyme
MREVITDARQVTPEWLTSVLRRNGRVGDGKVVRVSCRDEKKTFTSTAAHLEVTYSTPIPLAAPTRLFLKMSRSAAGPGEFSEEHLKREIEFYDAVASSMPDPPSIACYDAVYSYETKACHLLLDDITDTHFQPDHPLPPSESECKGAIDCLAGFHAFWWDHPRLRKDFGSAPTEAERKEDWLDAQRRTREFLDYLGDRISPDRRQVYDDVLKALPKLSERQMQARNLTLVHGDAHMWNFVFPRDPPSDRIRMVDWQFWHPTIGPMDLAFMIAREWYPERRRRLEEKLLKRYHGILVRQGVKGYDWHDCRHDYRLSVIQVCLFIPVWQWSLFKAKPDTWWSGLERAMLAYDDLNCAELLGD